MKVKTYVLCLEQSGIEYDAEKLQQFQEKLDNLVNAKKSAITIISKYNYKGKIEFRPCIWAIENDESKNKEIIDIIKKYLDDIGNKYYEDESELIWYEDKFYHEI